MLITLVETFSEHYNKASFDAQEFDDVDHLQFVILLYKLYSSNSSIENSREVWQSN